MPYVTVFEITQKPFQWWFSGFGLIFVVIGFVLIVVGRRWPSQKRSKITGYVMIVFASLWTALAFVSTFSEYRECTEAYRAGNYSVIEGTVENFHPMPYEGHQDECFSVPSKRFCYSDYGVQAGFNQSASHGGPVRQGLPVRVAYYGDQILRLEVRAHSLPSLSERSAYSTTEQHQWEQRQQKEPVLDHMNLEFAFAVVLITLCWNLDWQHYMRYWIRRGPPYGRCWQLGFRAFFFANFLGATAFLAQQIMHKHRTAKDYELSALNSLIWVGFFVVADGFFRWWLRRKKPLHRLVHLRIEAVIYSLTTDGLSKIPVNVSALPDACSAENENEFEQFCARLVKPFGRGRPWLRWTRALCKFNCGQEAM